MTTSITHRSSHSSHPTFNSKRMLGRSQAGNSGSSILQILYKRCHLLLRPRTSIREGTYSISSSPCSRSPLSTVWRKAHHPCLRALAAIGSICHQTCLRTRQPIRPSIFSSMISGAITKPPGSRAPPRNLATQQPDLPPPDSHPPAIHLREIS